MSLQWSTRTEAGGVSQSVFFKLKANTAGRPPGIRRLSKQIPRDLIARFRSAHFAAEHVFPYPNYADSRFPQQSSYLQGPLPVGRYFGAPVRSVCFGEPEASGTSVPEAPVHEHGNALFGEPKIWAPRNRSCVHLPTAYCCSYKSEPHSLFCRTVACRSDLRHECASFAYRQNVHSPSRGDNR
jgi:hypothetical protein